MNHKYQIGKWFRISSLYLNEYINTKILFYPYPIQYIFRYIWLYKLKKKYAYKINIKNFKNTSNPQNNYKVHNFNKKIIDLKDYIIIRYAETQRWKLNSLEKKINLINHTNNRLLLKTDFKRFNANISIKTKNKNANFKISSLSYFFIFIISINELLLFLPFVLAWLLPKKRYIKIIHSCILEWFSFIIKRRVYYKFYKKIKDKKVYFLFNSYGNEAEICAIKATGNKVIEILHSHVHIDHYGYNRYFKKLFRKDVFTPDEIIGHEEYEPLFKNINYSKSNIFQDHFLINKQQKINSAKKLPVLIGQPDSYNQIQFFLERKKYKKIIYKPHPRESSLNIKYLQKKYNLIIDNSDIEELIYNSEILICPLSSVIIPLLNTNKKIIIIDKKQMALRYLGIKESKLPKNLEFFKFNT